MTDVPVLVEHLFRHEAGRLVARLTRVFGARHLAVAEEVVQEALIAALQLWPHQGLPDDPAAWLMRVARNRALDRVRRDARLAGKADELARLAAWRSTAATPGPPPGALASPFDDDRLGLMFMACHPVLARENRLALTLRSVCGFSVREIARAFLTSEPTIAQRLVRAKRVLRERDVSLAFPSEQEIEARLDSVLDVVYLVFNEGYSAHDGAALVRHDLCDEALWLGRQLAAHPITGRPVTHALVALVALQAARLPARVNPEGEIVELGHQDRTLWDRRLLALGFAHLARAATGHTETVYHLQAAIAACHASATSDADTDWRAILGLYDALVAMLPTPIVALNRAVATFRVHGPAPALDAIAPLRSDKAMAGYFLLPAVEGRFREALGDVTGAAACYREALTRRATAPERRFLRRKLDELGLVSR